MTAIRKNKLQPIQEKALNKLSETENMLKKYN